MRMQSVMRARPVIHDDAGHGVRSRLRRYISPVSICALFYMAAVVSIGCPYQFQQHMNSKEYGSVSFFNVDTQFFEAFSAIRRCSCILGGTTRVG